MLNCIPVHPGEMSCLPFIRKRFRFFLWAASLVLGLLPAACLLVWLGLFCWDAFRNLHFAGTELYGFLCGSAIGLIVGLALGLKNRRDILHASDDLLSQIEELKG